MLVFLTVCVIVFVILSNSRNGEMQLWLPRYCYIVTRLCQDLFSDAAQHEKLATRVLIDLSATNPGFEPVSQSPRYEGYHNACDMGGGKYLLLLVVAHSG